MKLTKKQDGNLFVLVDQFGDWVARGMTASEADLILISVNERPALLTRIEELEGGLANLEAAASALDGHYPLIAEMCSDARALLNRKEGRHEPI